MGVQSLFSLLLTSYPPPLLSLANFLIFDISSLIEEVPPHRLHRHFLGGIDCRSAPILVDICRYMSKNVDFCVDICRKMSISVDFARSISVDICRYMSTYVVICRCSRWGGDLKCTFDKHEVLQKRCPTAAMSGKRDVGRLRCRAGAKAGGWRSQPPA